MRYTALAALMLMMSASPADAQSGFYLPTAAPTSGQDEFRAADGTTCRSTMDGARRVEIGTFASGGNGDLPGYGLSSYRRNDSSIGNAGVYGRFSMSLDAAPARMNCNLLYKIEIERRMLELEMMKRSLASADRRLDEQMAGAPATSAAAGAPVESGPKARPEAARKPVKNPPGKVAAKARTSPPP